MLLLQITHTKLLLLVAFPWRPVTMAGGRSSSWRQDDGVLARRKTWRSPFSELLLLLPATS